MSVDKTISNVLISCHEDNEKKRCPICKSLNTKKHGFINSNILSVRGLQKRKIQRFFCKECHKSFTSQGHNKRQKTSTHLKNKAVRDFVHTKNSLQEVADRYQVSKTSVLNWLKKTASDISDNFKPLSNLDDVLLIDGKEIKVNGNKKVLLISKTFLFRSQVLATLPTSFPSSRLGMHTKQKTHIIRRYTLPSRSLGASLQRLVISQPLRVLIGSLL